MLDREQYLDRWSELHGGYDPRASAVIRVWLTGAYAAAYPMARLRVPPSVVTLLGVLVAAAALYPAWLGGRWLLLSAVLVALSGAVDSLDGAVAVMTGRTTRWGFVLDSLVDRLADVAYLVALWIVGAPGWLCVTAGVLMGLHEYARARAGHAGMRDVGTITVSERPTRVILTALVLLGCGLHVPVAEQWATAGAAAWAVVGAVGLVHLLVVIHQRLSADEPGSGVADEAGDDLG